MRMLLRLGLAFLLIGSIGASALYYNVVTTPYENLMRKWIAQIDEATALLAGVTDEVSAKDAAAKLTAGNDAFLDLVKRTKEENGEVTSGEDARLQNKYGYQFEEAGRKFRTYQDHLRGRRPELWKILEEAAGRVPGVKSPAERFDDDLHKQSRI